MVKATRNTGLDLCASQLEDIFDTTPRNDTTDSVHKPQLQNEANGNSISVPGKENGVTVYLMSGKGD